MKLRIRGNSIRLRVLQDELDRFQQGFPISEELIFPGTRLRLRYSLHHQEQPEDVAVSFDGTEIKVSISNATLAHWIRPQEIGIYTEISVGNDALSVAIEKDFACLDRPEEDNVGTFVNPLAKGRIC